MAADWKTPCWHVISEPGGPLACLLTCWCPCVTYGINLSKLPEAKEKSELSCAGEFTPACCFYCLSSSVGCPCIAHIPARKYIRKKYGIKEPQNGLLEEVLLTWCCSCCVLIQDYNEIAAQTGAPAGGVGSDFKNAVSAATADVKQQAAELKEGLTKPAEKEAKEEKEPKEAKEEKEPKEVEKEEKKEEAIEVKAAPAEEKTEEGSASKDA